MKRYALDNSSLFYPIMATKKSQSNFRMTATLLDDVDGGILREAVQGVMRRFPTFSVSLKRGYAWHYLLQNDNDVKVFSPVPKLLSPIDYTTTNGHLFRLSYEGKDIALDIFHGLCDGNGAIVFFRTVLYKYSLLKGIEVDGSTFVNIDEDPCENEIEDAFARYYKHVPFGEVDLKGLAGKKPHLLGGTINADGCLSSSAICKYSQLSAKAKELGVTFTEYVCGVLAYVISAVEKSVKKDIVLMIPINLRKVFPSNNFRNFVTFIRLEFSPNECVSIADCARVAKEQLRSKSTKEKLEGLISTTGRTARAGILRLSPVWLKIGIAKVARLFMKSRQTIIFSNLGRVDIPDEMGVSGFRVNMNVSKNAKVNLGVATLGENVDFTFSRSITEDDLPEAFFAELESLGIDLKR